MPCRVVHHGKDWPPMAQMGQKRRTITPTEFAGCPLSSPERPGVRIRHVLRLTKHVFGFSPASSAEAIVGQNHRRIANDVCKPDGIFGRDRPQKSPAEAGLPSGRNAVPKRTTIR